MDEINLNNYESFLLDLSEGRLSADMQEKIKVFVLSHPELDIDLDDLELPYFTGGIEKFESKELLKKEAPDKEDEKLISYLENKLSLQERIKVEAQMKADPLFLAEFELYKKTILVPDLQLSLDDKSSLLKTEIDVLSTESYKLVAYAENKMSGNERAVFEKELEQSALLRAELDLVLQTHLSSDPSIVFPNKEALKKKNRVFVLYSTRNIARMAAAVLLLVVFSFVLNYFTNRSDKNLVSSNSSKTNNARPSDKQPSSLIPEKRNQPDPLASLISKTNNSNQRVTINTGNPKPVPADLVLNPRSETQEEKEIENKEPLSNESEHNVQVAMNSNRNDVHSGIDTINTMQFYKLPLEEDEETTYGLDDSGTKTKGFWKRAVAMAQRANRMGFKSVDGEEHTSQKYRLTFNNVSVEKR